MISVKGVDIVVTSNYENRCWDTVLLSKGLRHISEEKIVADA